ncbi:hypothetical protein [Desulfosarcina cetonica]|uniref:hypothetical protein n=1 Tax=Desulfosarcina cetonica TaxID=90730 RepID=UPI0006CFE613|nr:hypothetical protein [Desulfosarcina cetonica]
MRKARGIIALLLAFSLAGICAYAVYGYLSKPRAKPEAAPVKAENPPPPRPRRHSVSGSSRGCGPSP